MMLRLQNRAEKTAARLIELLKKHSLTLALAESCTAGLVSSVLVNTSGASSVLWGSFVCYMTEAKVSMLGLNKESLDKYGTVSKETACALAEAALEKSGTSIAAAVTGFAGKEGDDKACGGTVWVAVSAKQDLSIDTKTRMFLLKGSRNQIRNQAVIAVLNEILEILPKI